MPVRYLKLTIYTSLVAVMSSYILVHVLIYKGNQEIEHTKNMIFTIHQLKDLHTLCILDYKFNPYENDILDECKNIELQITSQVDTYYDKTPYLNFYKKYIQ